MTKLFIFSFLIFLLGCSSNPTVYTVCSNKPDKCIERIFKTRTAAEKYIENYKDSHDYYCEILELSE